jgi:hypothetical protein
MSESETNDPYRGEDPRLPWRFQVGDPNAPDGYSDGSAAETVPVSSVQLLRIAGRFEVHAAIRALPLLPVHSLCVVWRNDPTRPGLIIRLEEDIPDRDLMEAADPEACVRAAVERIIERISALNPLVAVCVYGLLVGFTHLRLSPGLAAAVSAFTAEASDGE